MTKKAAAASGTKKRSQAQEVWLRLKKNKQAMVGLAVFCLIVLICFSAPLYMDYDARVIQQNISEKLQAPSAEHLLGTDNYGRDTLARLIFGGRISITIGIVTALSALAVGGIIGAESGFCRYLSTAQWYCDRWQESVLWMFSSVCPPFCLQ